jgi:hypothetical protein
VEGRKLQEKETTPTTKPATEQGTEGTSLEDKRASPEMNPEVLAALEAAEQEGIQIC